MEPWVSIRRKHKDDDPTVHVNAVTNTWIYLGSNQLSEKNTKYNRGQNYNTVKQNGGHWLLESEVGLSELEASLSYIQRLSLKNGEN